MAGRSGMGGGGGGSRSSEGGGGSRGSYGGRGGSRSGRSGISNSSFNHSSFHGYRPPPPRPRYGGYYHSPYRSHHTVVHTHSSPLTTVLAFIIVLVCLFIYYRPFGFFGSDIVPSTIDRDPLPKDAVVETEYYSDIAGWISNSTELTKGLKHFYQETGVQPYIYITNEVGGSRDPSDAQMEEFANQLYDELFQDEAHALMVFQDADGHYSRWLVVGSQGKTVIDAEAADILFGYIDSYYYDSSLSSEEYFSKAFADAADRMMTKTTSPVVVVGIGFAVLAGIIIIAYVILKKIKHEKEESERAERILNADVSTDFSNPAIKDLEDKYL